MNLKQRFTKEQKKEQKKQEEAANRLVNITNEIFESFKEKDLQVFEADLITGLLKKRIDTEAQNFVGQRKLNELK